MTIFFELFDNLLLITNAFFEIGISLALNVIFIFYALIRKTMAVEQPKKKKKYMYLIYHIRNVSWPSV